MMRVAIAFVLVFMAAPALGGPREAIALYEAWQLEEARRLAEVSLAEDPTDPEALLLAGLVQHARGEHLAAVSLLRAAGALDKGGVLPLAEGSARYAAHFKERESEHFVVRYLDKDEIVATYALDVLEAAYRGIGAALAFSPPERPEPIVVEIYPDARGLAAATGLKISEIEKTGTIAVCKFHRVMIVSPLATAAGYDWATTLAHELTHLVISKKSKNTIPIWLHEGIAKYFESTWRGEAGANLSPHGERLLAQALREKRLITYQQMHPSMAKLSSQQDAALAYAEVFTTIEYLIGEHGEKSVARLLELAATGLPLEEVLRRVYGMGMKQLEAGWKGYLQKRPFRQGPLVKPAPLRLVASEPAAEAARPLEDMPDRVTHDHARLGELLTLRGHTKAAVLEYEKAYARSGVTYPSLVYRLARAYLETERKEEALKIIDKGRRVHPDDAELQLLAGRTRFFAGDLTRAREDLEAARLRNPFNPEAHAILQRIYEKLGDKARAAEAARFLELARKPRPSRSYELLAPREGNATINIVALPFAEVKLNGEKLAAPIWQVPVMPGEQVLEHTPPGARPREARVTLGEGESRTVVLR